MHGYQNMCDNTTTDAEIYSLAVARISTSVVCLTLGMDILVLICVRRLFKTATQRQYLYLVVVTEVYLLMLAAGVDRIFTDYASHDTFCAVLGFLGQWMATTELFFTFSIIVVLHVAILGKHVRLTTAFCRGRLHRFSGRRYRLTLEAAFVLLSIASPPLLDWLPFKDHRYGLSGAWCWIMSSDDIGNANCSDVGFAYQLSLNYVPTFFISVTAVVLTIVTNVVLCHAACKHRDTSYHHRKRAKEVALLLLCITLSSILVVPELVTRISIYTSKVILPYSVYMMYAIGTPLGRLILSFDLYVYLYSFNTFSWTDEDARLCRRRCCSENYYRLDIEDGDIEYIS